MSKSLKRVETALAASGVSYELREMTDQTRTAAQAAQAAGCAIDQIAKSIIFSGSAEGSDGDLCLFLTAGGRQVDPQRAAQVAGTELGRADGAYVRKVTGFAIGGVSPLGHLTAPRSFMDPRLMDFDLVWAAAGTPRHIFSIAPADLQRIAQAELADFAE